jgi:Flp pilus assembly protein TadB
VLWLCGGATFVLVWCLTVNSATVLTRLRVRPTSPTRPGVARSPVEEPRQRLAVCIAGCSVGGWLVSGQLGAALGVPAGVWLSWWVSRLESPSQAREREEISRDLPLAADLLSACVLVGRPVDESLRLVSTALGGALGARLDHLTARLALGSDPLVEWRRATGDPQLGALARTMVRTLESGAPVGDALSRLAEDRRRERRTQTQLRARTVGVKAAGPLAACFLPAFMLIGIVPTIAGAFSNLVL